MKRRRYIAKPQKNEKKKGTIQCMCIFSSFGHRLLRSLTYGACSVSRLSAFFCCCFDCFLLKPSVGVVVLVPVAVAPPGDSGTGLGIECDPSIGTTSVLHALYAAYIGIERYSHHTNSPMRALPI